VDLGLERHVAIVTGASRGLGRSIVEAFVAEGMQVLAAARSEDELRILADHSPAGAVIPVVCDMTDRVSVESLSEKAVESFGRLDVVVNNAGIAPAARFEAEPIGSWDEVLAVNLLAPVALSKTAGAVFLGQGHGKVINIASTAGLRGKPTLAAYSASKGALLRFTEALANEWASRNIQVNAIAPGAFETDAQKVVLESPEILAKRLRKIPAGRMGRANEIGPLACYLSSPLSDFVTGSVYVIDGGEASRL
jgi:2-deoxy-D-gluconate 3-dehydrogenase